MMCQVSPSGGSRSALAELSAVFRDPVLFRDGTLAAWLQARRQAAIQQVDHVPAAAVRQQVEDVVTDLVNEYAVTPVTLHWDAMTRTDATEAKITQQQFGDAFSARGQSLNFIVPFNGEPELFKLQANTYSMGATVEAAITDSKMVFRVQGQGLTSEAVLARIDGVRKSVEEHLTWAHADVQAWNEALRIAIDATAKQRQQALADAASLSDSLDIPLVATGAVHEQIPVKRTRLRVQDTHPVSLATEPRLADEMYEDVLRTLQALGRAVERLPKTAYRFNENEWRDLLLFILNSNYEGAARGEVFNGKGKTDLLLPWRDRNVFIGECNFWRGQHSCSEAIKQLLGYVVWRDTKAALIIFIERKDASAVITKADDVIRGHPAFKQALGGASDSDVRRDYLLTAEQDAARTIRLALLPIVVEQLPPPDDDGSTEDRDAS
jgi:hypothetical protein